MKQIRRITERMPWIAAAAALGALVFVGVQVVTGSPQHIAEFIGGQIVRQGGYSESLQGVIGWGVHFGVAISYVTLFAVLLSLPFLPTARAARRAIGLAVAIALGVVSTLITAPAITATISLLAGKGFPGSLPGLNTAWGLAFWNHLGFFLIAFLFIVVVPDLLANRLANSTGAARALEG